VKGKGKFTLQKDMGVVDRLAFSPDGTALAVACEKDEYKIILWDVFRRRKIRILNGKMVSVKSMAFSPSGKKLATGASQLYSGSKTHGVGILWDVANGKQINSFNSDTGYVSAIGFSPKGNILATAGYDSTIKLWKIKGDKGDKNKEK
jgi:WD40 repeat protein